MLLKRFSYFQLLFFVGAVILLAGCSPTSANIAAADSQIMDAGDSFGQSFTSINNGLAGLSILLGPSSPSPAGNLVFKLRSNAAGSEELASGILPLSEISQKNYYKFDFPPINDSQGKDYFLEVNVEGDGGVEVFSAEADSYLNGAMYENRVPQEAQLGFRLEYDRKNYLSGLFFLGLNWIYFITIGGFSFIIPGWALFSFFWRGWEKSPWPSKLGLAGGLSLAIYPILFLWTNLIGLNLGSAYAWAPVILGILALCWKNRAGILRLHSSVKKLFNLSELREKINLDVLLADIALIIILGLIIISRFWVVRSLDIPLFGDSYQHTMITQLMIDHGGLFDSWKPYADLESFTYHFGYHSVAAVYHWLTGVNAEKAVLITGQLINILAILGLYPLAYKVTRSRWAGVIAVLIGGLLSPMPMAYLNWGRYTQLAGQVILCTSILTAWELLDKPIPDFKNISWFKKFFFWRNLSIDFGSFFLAFLTLGGLSLVHYRIVIIAILFLPAYALITFSKRTIITILGRILWIGLGSLIISLPWLIQVYGGKLVEIIAAKLSAAVPKIATGSELFNSIGNLDRYFPILIWMIFLVCIGWGLWKQRKEIAIISLWWFFILIATNPYWLGLPGNGVITNFAILIAFYIPVSVVLGSTFGRFQINTIQTTADYSKKHKNKYQQLMVGGLLLVIICSLGIWSLPDRIRDLDISSHALVTKPDLRAMDWIRENTKINEKILVNSFFAYNNSLVVGSDAGWWIPLLAERKTTLPPITYGIEEGGLGSSYKEINALNREIIDKGITDQKVLSLLKENGIRYIYIGQRQGSVNNPGGKVLDPQVLLKNPNFKALYNEDRVWIFEILQ